MWEAGFGYPRPDAPPGLAGCEMLNGGLCAGHCTDGFNGWLRDGQLVPLPPVNGRDVYESW